MLLIRKTLSRGGYEVLPSTLSDIGTWGTSLILIWCLDGGALDEGELRTLGKQLQQMELNIWHKIAAIGPTGNWFIL